MNKNILLVNDDGYSVLTATLRKALVRAGANVRTYLPHKDRSGKGSALCVKPMKIESSVNHDHDAFFVNGYPTDCTRLGIAHSTMEGFAPDLVISGINNGWNPSGCTSFSGTIQAALTGKAHGIQSIAVSCDRNTYGYSTYQARHLAAAAVVHIQGLVEAGHSCNLNLRPWNQHDRNEELDVLEQPLTGGPMPVYDEITGTWTYDWDGYWAQGNEVTRAIEKNRASVSYL